VSEYAELCVCFEEPPERPSDALVLSFLPAHIESKLESEWGRHFVNGRVLAQDLRKEARGYYLDLIARVGATPIDGRTFREALQGPDGYSRWWFLKTSEKDCVWDQDGIYNAIIQLLCVKRVADKQGLKRVRLVGGAPEFAMSLAGSFELVSHQAPKASVSMASMLLLGVLGRVMCAIFYLRLWWLLKRLPAESPQDFDVLFEAHLDWSVGVDAQGKLRDRYFTDLPSKLEARGVKVGWLAWCEPDRGVRQAKRLRDLVTPVRRPGSMVLLERHLKPWDIVAAASRIRYLLEFIRFSRSMAFRELFRIERLDLYPLLKTQMFRLLSGASICRMELLATAVGRVCRAARPKMVLTFLELILHARALYVGARLGYPAVKLWTAQHAAYASDKTFGAIKPDVELTGEPDHCAIPAPDGIFVMGELGRRFWLGNGFNSERVIMTGGLRYQHLQVVPPSMTLERTASVTILLIAGMNQELDFDMCAAISEAARDFPSIRLRLREHPQYGLRKRGGFKRLRDRIELSTGTVEEDLRDADLVLFTHSGMAEEALLQGKPVWQWLWAGFNTSVFLDIPVIPSFTRVSDLREALRSFLESPARYQPIREGQELVFRECFGLQPERASERIAEKVIALLNDRVA
jgi:surface carbohydrate biosynthesis protein (TIGR04326 family)